MTYVKRSFPALKAEHVRSARLFAHRDHMLAAIEFPTNGVAVEVGVALGDFSQVMLDTLNPSRFIAIDTFDMHTYPEHWGHKSEILFKGMTHEAFYRDRFKNIPGLSIVCGLSHDALAAMDDESADLIYVDASHTYDGVKQDAVLSYAKAKRGGTIIFNDYTLYDQFLGTTYGIIPAVHELVNEKPCRVIGLALNQDMFCDMAIQKL